MKGKIAVISILFMLIGVGIGAVSTFILKPSGDNSAYNDLMNDYNDLLDDYNDLLDDYNDLVDNYTQLFTDFQLLSDAFTQPLTNPVKPNEWDVVNWLAIDDTDTFGLVNNTWMAGDFSAMLMTRAKTMNWRMGISIMEYSYGSDPGYYVNDTSGSYTHVFCWIEISSGLGLLFIDPQSDATWSRSFHYVVWTLEGFLSAIQGTVWYGLGWLWINNYNYFA